MPSVTGNTGTVTLVLSLALAAGSLACADEMVDPDPTGPEVCVPEFLLITLQPDGDTVEVNDSLQLTASYLWPPGQVRSLTWTSTNTSIAAVSGTGMVYALKPGSVGVRVVLLTTQGGAGSTIAVVHVR